MSSLQSRLWEFFLKPLYSQKARIKDELNIKLARLIVAPFPPAIISKKFSIEIQRQDGSNIFTIIPKDCVSDKIIFYLHGGAYIAGITWPHWRFIRNLIDKTGVRVAMVDYPVAPESDYTHTLDMVLNGYKQVLKGNAPSQIVVMGDSAGGGLALAMAQELKKNYLPQPSCLILLCPWLDVTMSNPDIKMFERKDSLLSKKALVSAGKHYANGADRTMAKISPIYGEFEGLAEIHLFIGTHDLLAADARKLKDRMMKTNARFFYHEYDRMYHVWMLFPIPEAKAVIAKVDEIIKYQLV